MFLRQTVKTILDSSQWKEALRTASDVNHKLDTPMRNLIRKFPDLAEAVLDKCYKETKSRNQLSAEMNFEFIDDTFNYTRKKKTFVHYTEDPEWDFNDEGYKVPYDSKGSTYDCMVPIPVLYDPNFQRRVTNHPMMMMVSNNRVELLRHPLCLAFVRYKWHSTGRISYYLILIQYCLFLGSLTGFVLTSPSPVQNPQYYNCTEYFSSRQNTTVQPLYDESFEYDVYWKKSHLASQIAIWILFCFYFLKFILEETPLTLIKVCLLFLLLFLLLIAGTCS